MGEPCGLKNRNGDMMSLIPVRIAYAALGSGSAPVWIAKAAGIFADEGLEAEVTLIRGSRQVTEALMSGGVQFANIASPFVVNAKLNGADLVYLTGGINYLIQSIVTRREIQSAAQLRGRNFGISSSGGVDNFLVDFLLRPQGINAATELNHIIIENQPDAVAKLDCGDIDGALFSPPYCFEAVKHGHKMLIDAGDYGIDYQLGGIVACRSYVEQNPEITSRLVRSYVRGIHSYKSDADLALRIFREYSLIHDLEVARQCYERANRYFQRKPYPTVSGLQRVLDEAAKKDPSAKRLRVGDMVDCRWLAELDNSGFIDQLYARRDEA
jgi:ABC-type nitrate/sulfonate/bicarbonate transport system substrate-binding protein